MRVISGSARGRKLKEPDGQNIRPTTDMVKESIFNIIQFDIEGRRVLDLFAGTGQLGIEALSRGAAAVVFVDASNDAVKLVRDNIKVMGFDEKATVAREDALAFLGRGGGFDVIFLDPPYESNLIEKALKRIIEFDILKENGIIICETKEDKPLPEPAVPYIRGREYRYGKIKITLYTKTNRAEA
ncbi:16S rRNA (guanine(966)-N(2))-methyltransferase RsmD [Sporobacter termitidis DSM 10068]|uniref:16S rRNA (Guanine(966)-N(2))-methyltransferase RsmD n=2 Tax=Sporobacter TaxID=44748 RepID=A0A1M5WZG8_9FIRM|nr:16S rRNA (guanine(966)-N(2))-methyltransferase RsmD [Sporobacter termitidis DSM 10068]